MEVRTLSLELEGASADLDVSVDSLLPL